MRLGFALPQCGSAARPDAITTVAQRAEAVGFDSLWVFDRTLSPVNPNPNPKFGLG
jgi:alkanesulfonate monooxygenase SsuD/methylene tetrahydromethanopterin reductase-like flavin-dependent oxidoreductase (luciferase family)